MRQQIFMPLLTASLALLASALLCVAAEQSVTVKLSELPSAAQKTVHQQLGRGKINSIEKYLEDGETTYGVEITKANRARSFTVGEDGKLLDMEMFLPETPAAVQAAIKTYTATAEIDGITKVLEDDDITYEIEMTKNNQSRTFTLDERGELLEMQFFLPETPAVVQATIRKQSAGATLGDITKVIDEGEVTFEVEMTKAGKERTFTISDDGKLLEEQVFLPELPADLQKAIQSQAAKGKLGDLTRSNEDGEILYDAEITRDGKLHTITFDAKGAVLSDEEDITLSDTPAPVQKAIQDLLGEGKLTSLTKTVASDETTYDLEFRKLGKTQSLTLAPDGKVLPD